MVHTLRISEKDVFDESVIRGLLLQGFVTAGVCYCWGLLLQGSVTAGVPCLWISAHYPLLANWVKFSVRPCRVVTGSFVVNAEFCE